MRLFSLAFLFDDDIEEHWRVIPQYPNYMISNKHKIYNIERNTVYHYNLKQNIKIYNSNENYQNTLKSFLINTFDIKHDYIYLNETFYIIPTCTTYMISNYNRVIDRNKGNILKNNKDTNRDLYINALITDDNKECKNPSIQYLWTLYNTNGYIEENKEDDDKVFMCEAEYFINIPDFPGYSVSNYGKIKRNKTQRILTQRKSEGYYIIELSINKKRYKLRVHYLVIITFKEKAPSNKHTIDHKDRQRDNNNPLRAKPTASLKFTLGY